MRLFVAVIVGKSDVEDDPAIVDTVHLHWLMFRPTRATARINFSEVSAHVLH
jgi:hypothetical protein